MSVYRSAVRKLDLTGCLVAHRGHGFFELFETFANLESVQCEKVVMSRPKPPLHPTSADILVTRRLPMRTDGIFYTIHSFEPCVPRFFNMRVSYALEFGGMPRAGAINFAQGHNESSTVPPVLKREIYSLMTHDSHSAGAWLRILTRRNKDGFAPPKHIILSQTEPASMDEFKVFVQESGANIEELGLSVDLTKPSITAVQFFETVDWTTFKSLTVLKLALVVPPPPDARTRFTARPRLKSTATVISVSEEPLPEIVSAPVNDAHPSSPTTTTQDASHLGVRKRVTRPVSGLFKGIGAFAKGALGKDWKPKAEASAHLQPADFKNQTNGTPLDTRVATPVPSS